MTTAAQVFQDFQSQLGSMEAAADNIADRIDDIQTGHPGLPPTQEENEAVSELLAQRRTISKGIQKLGYVTAMTLDNSDDAQDVVKILKGITDDLKAAQDKLVAIGKAVQAVGNVLSGLSSLATKIKSLSTQ